MKLKKTIVVLCCGLMFLGGCTPAVSSEAPAKPTASDRAGFISGMTHEEEHTDSYLANKAAYEKVASDAEAHPGVFREYEEKYKDTFIQIRARSANVAHNFEEAKNTEVPKQDRTMPEQSELPEISKYESPWTEQPSIPTENVQ